MMFVRRSALAAARQATRRTPINVRTFSASIIRSKDHHAAPPVDTTGIKPLDQIKSESDLLAPGAPVGTIPTDLNQATGLERLEILAKMQGYDLWDLKPLDASRLGTMEDPIIVKADGPEQYVGCTGYPVDSHWVRWLTVSKDRPIERCDQCGNVIKLELLNRDAAAHHDDHGHDDHGHDHHDVPDWSPKNLSDFVKPEYHYK